MPLNGEKVPPRIVTYFLKYSWNFLESGDLPCVVCNAGISFQLKALKMALNTDVVLSPRPLRPSC